MNKTNFNDSVVTCLRRTYIPLVVDLPDPVN